MTSTLFTLDAGVARAVRVLGLVNHNLSSAGTVRFRGFSAVPILDALDFSAGWSAQGTPVRTAASYSGSGADGVPLDLIEDDDGAAAEGYFRTVAFTGDGTKFISIRMKAGTAGVSSFGIWDNTAAAWRHRIHVTWTGGVPSVASAAGAGSEAATLIGDGVYRLTATVENVVAANTNQFYARPTSQTSADTGTAYIGDALAWDAATDQLVYDTGCEAALPAGSDAESRDGWLATWTHVTSAAQTARYWRCNINDTTNADTYVEIGRLIIAGGFQPTVNASYGATLGYTDPHSTHDDADGGATIHGAKPRRRTCDLLCELMSESEAFGTPFEMARRLGTTGQLFFVFDPDDTTLLHKRSFLATLRELSPIEFPHPTYHSTPFRVVEEL